MSHGFFLHRNKTWLLDKIGFSTGSWEDWNIITKQTIEATAIQSMSENTTSKSMNWNTKENNSNAILRKINFFTHY